MRRREGGREGEVIPRVWESTVAAEGMFGNLNPLGDGPGRSLADHGARVPEVLPAAELEGFLTGLTIAMPRKPGCGAAMGDDVEEAQELAVKAPAGGYDARHEGVLESSISGPVAVDLGASGALEEPAGLRVAEGSISAHVSQMISAEFVVDCDVDDQVAAAAEVDVLEHQVAPPHLAVALRDGGDVAPLRGDPSLPADFLYGVEDGLVGSFAAACVLLAGMDVIAECVNDVAAAGADTLLAPQLLKRRDGLAEELAEPRLPLLCFDGRVSEA